MRGGLPTGGIRVPTAGGPAIIGGVFIGNQAAGNVGRRNLNIG